MNSWWYRLVQVLYCFFIILLIIVATTLVVETWPRFSVSESNYKFICEINDFTANFKGSKLNSYQSDFDSFYLKYDRDVNQAVESCPPENLSFTEFKKYGRVVNYKFVLIEKGYTGKWWHPVSSSFFSLVFITIASLLVRAIFQYVAFAKPFWRTLLIKKTD